MATARVASAIVALGLATGCGSSHVAVVPSHPHPPGPTGTLLQGLHAAKASESLFSIFPSQPGVIHCSIPAGLLRILGTCRTTVRVAQTHEPALIVSFVESWKVGPCGAGYCPPSSAKTRRHTWQLMVSLPSGSFRSAAVVRSKTRSFGAVAPQALD